MNRLFGTYAGIVEKVDDPERLGRIKVRVPHVYGVTGLGTGYVGTNDLPWALPAGMPAGGGPLSGGFSMLPEPDDRVWVRFLDGEPEKPIWEWAMQTQDHAKSLKLHSYDKRGGQVGKPDAVRLTRYGHLLEMVDGAVTLTTKGGYRVFLLDSSDEEQDGNIKIATTKGNYLQLDDSDDTATLSVNQDLYLTVLDEIIAQCRSLSLTVTDDATVEVTNFDLTANENIDLKAGVSFSVDALEGVIITTPTVMQFEFAALTLGEGASEPFVLGTQLATFLETLIVWLDTHTHSNGNFGSPTGVPIVPTTGVVQPQITALLSEVITGL